MLTDYIARNIVYRSYIARNIVYRLYVPMAKMSGNKF